MRKLFFGDNLGVLRDYVDDESVDLIYLDPPFNSSRKYNLLFGKNDRRDSNAQKQAFDDTWSWDRTAERNFHELAGNVESTSPIPPKLSPLVRALFEFLTPNDMMAYLTMMGLRLVELRRVLRPTGTLYLHCDPTASAYLRILCDAVFGPEHFISEITWQRTNVHSDAKRWSPVADHLLVYSKSETFVWNEQRVAHDESYLASKYRLEDARGRYQLDNITSPNPRPNMTYEWKGHESPPNGWRYSRETMADLDAKGLIWYPDSKAKRPRLKRYLDLSKGRLVGNVWTDIAPLNSQADERIGYPTQKPVALLARVISASSNPGDVVLDPFCGCGTSIEAAERLKRSWIGIDIATLAIDTIRDRIERVFGKIPYKLGGNPPDADSARLLATQDKHEFQDWAVRFVNGRPPGGAEVAKRGRDRGIDGELIFRVIEGGKQYRAIISVKGGKLNPSMVRDLAGTVAREKAEIGVFVCAQSTTREMRTEAARAGDSTIEGRRFPRIQLLTVDDLFSGQQIKHPGENVTEGLRPPPEQLDLFDHLRDQAEKQGLKGVAKSKPPPASSVADENQLRRDRAKKTRRLNRPVRVHR